MLINLSDVLSEQHKTIDITVAFETESFQTKSGVFPIIEKEPVHVVVSHIKEKELRIQVSTKVAVVIPCDRCLADVKQEFLLEFTKYVDLGVSDAELERDSMNPILLTDIILTWTKCSITRYW